MKMPKNHPSAAIIGLFFLLVVAFFGAIAVITAPPLQRAMRYSFIVLGAALLFGGLALAITSYRDKSAGRARKFLLLMGVSSAGIVVFSILHNLVYALFVVLFGENFWGASGDEPAFFILSIIACPLGFIAGLIGIVTVHFKKGKGQFSCEEKRP